MMIGILKPNKIKQFKNVAHTFSLIQLQNVVVVLKWWVTKTCLIF